MCTGSKKEDREPSQQENNRWREVTTPALAHYKMAGLSPTLVAGSTLGLPSMSFGLGELCPGHHLQLCFVAESSP